VLNPLTVSGWCYSGIAALGIAYPTRTDLCNYLPKLVGNGIPRLTANSDARTMSKPVPERITLSTTLSVGFIDKYWQNMAGVTEAAWKSLPYAKRYESVLNHLAAQADMAAKLAGGSAGGAE
jgi:hypothetical protein